jgi:Tfp pilus assembly protein PilF
MVELHALLRRTPESALAHNLLGLAYEQQGEAAAAAAEFQLAVRLDPQAAEALQNLKSILGKTKTADPTAGKASDLQ